MPSTKRNDSSPSQSIERRRQKAVALRAGLLRVLFAVLGLLSVAFVPDLEAYAKVFAGYLILSLAFQALIAKRRGRSYRVIAMGIVDVLLVTVLVQALGTTQTPLTFFYLLIPIVFATTTSRRRVSMTLAIVGASAYTLANLLEQLALIPFAPLAAGASAPSTGLRWMSCLVVVTATITTARFVSQLIHALAEANSRLQDQSQRDELTALYNRRYLHLRLAAELGRVQRGGKLVLLMVDLDGFKRVNDEEGHDAGDRLLADVAGALLGATRRSDVVARYGGDEFVVLLPDTGLEGCQTVAARIVDHARDVARAMFPALPVTASVGVAEARADDDEISLIKRADEGVYAAKRGGGDRMSLITLPVSAE